MAEQRDIKYINKDFGDFKDQLVEYAKNYFPDTYNDFSPSSPGMMFIEMASYVGDILSFYQDTQLQETYLTYAKDPKNLYSLAYMMGYNPKSTGVSEVDIEITQYIDAGLNFEPNWNQAAVIQPNANITSTDNSNTSFLIQNGIDFTFSSSYDPTDIVIQEVDENTNPTSYRLRKKAKAFSGQIISTQEQITSSEKFKTLTITDSNIVGILDVTDSQGNIWYEVPYLGQDTVFIDESNTSTDSNRIPYVLKVKKTPRRFTSRLLSTGYIQLQFGAGTNNTDDSEILPDPSNLNIGTNNGIQTIDKAYDPSNFLNSRSYGIAPSNTTLTVRYIKGGGVAANVPANSITTQTSINAASANGDNSKLTFPNLTFNNPLPAQGGRDGDTVEELRENTLKAFNEQSRTVTLQDYTIRALSLPTKFGSISKAFATQDQLTNNNQQTTLVSNNPLAVSLYVLAYDNNKTLTRATNTLKQNLKTYLADYIPLTDSVNIKDAFVVNIGVNFDIVIRPNYSSRDVLLNCNLALKKFFDISKWGINQPVNLSQIYTALDKVKGVQTVQKVEIINKAGGNYSQYGYDTLGATRNNIMYPSFDPCIFEVKFPEQDIKGRITTL